MNAGCQKAVQVHHRGRIGQWGAYVSAGRPECDRGRCLVPVHPLQKIAYENPWTAAQPFVIRSSNPALLHVKQARLTVPVCALCLVPVV
jgi:hypothetical protein